MNIAEMSIIVAVIIGLSEAFKSIGVIKKWIPIINIILGIGAGLAFMNTGDIKEAILQGLIAGLTASGLFSTVKNTTQGIRG